MERGPLCRCTQLTLAILCLRANQETPAPMDARFCGLGSSGRICSYQPVCAGTSPRLGTSHGTRSALGRWRLVYLRISDARSLRGLKAVATSAAVSQATHRAASGDLFVVLCGLEIG